MVELDKIGKSLKDKQLLNKLFIGLMSLVEFIIFGALIHIAVQLMKGPGNEVYNLVAMGILLLWFGILVGYYAWAVYFYNINLGLTNQDWAEIREQKRYNPEGVDEPKENPNINQTLGLPTGTVRGSLALSLMVGGICMTIAGFGMENMVEENAFLVDNFDFFKTAFLMMIAFYFGNKSLEMMGYKSTRTIGRGQNSSNEDKTNTPPQPPAPVPPAQNASAAKDLLKNGKLDTPLTGSIPQTPKENDDFDISGSIQ